VEPAPGRRIRLVWADAACTGSRPAGWTATLKMTLRIIANRDPRASVDADA
jgi:hypothetical protein